MEDQKNNTTDNKMNSGQANGGNDSGMKAHGNEGGKGGFSNGEANKATKGQGDSAEKPTGASGSFMDVAKSTAGDAYEAVAAKASTAIGDKKTDFSVGLVGVADTVRRVSEAIKDGDSTNTVTEYASTYSDTAAKKLEQAAEYFETSDLKGMARDVETYARRHPAIFLGAAFAFGIMAARFIKSSPPSDLAANGATRGRSKSIGTADGVAAGASA